MNTWSRDTGVGITDAGVRRAALRVAVPVGLAAASYGLPFGVLGTAAGLSYWQVQTLSLVMYGGASQLAMVSALSAGASLFAASASATLLSVRSFFYSLSVRGLFPSTRARWTVAQLVSDESVASALNGRDHRTARTGFLTTGVCVYLLWNISTAVGALAGGLIGDPKLLGLDAVAPAALLALVAPRLRDRHSVAVFVAAMVIAVAVVPVVPVGLPVLLAITPIAVSAVFCRASAPRYQERESHE